MKSKELKKPSIALYIIATLVFIISVIISITLIFAGVSTIEANEKTNIVVPGEGQMAFDKASAHTIFIETETTVDGTYYGTPKDIPNMRVKIYNDQNEVLVKDTKKQISYSINGTNGYGILEFDIETPGIYHIQAEFTDIGAEPIVLAISASSEDTVKGILMFILSGVSLFIGVITLGVSVLVGVMKTLQYNRSQRKMN